MMRDIVLIQVPMKEFFSPEAKSLLSLLLERDPNQRIGGYRYSDNHPSSPPSN